MNVTGILLLFVCCTVVAFVGLHALDGAHNDVTSTDPQIQALNETAKSVEAPIFQTFSYLIMMVGIFGVIYAFRMRL
jgi:hypothetical protein